MMQFWDFKLFSGLVFRHTKTNEKAGKITYFTKQNNYSFQYSRHSVCDQYIRNVDVDSV